MSKEIIVNDSIVKIQYDKNIVVEIDTEPNDSKYCKIVVKNGETIKSWIGEEKVEYDCFVYEWNIGNILYDLTKNVDDMSNTPVRKCINAMKTYMAFVPYAEQVTTILNATLDTEELGLNEDWRQYFMDVATVKRGIWYKSEFHSNEYKVYKNSWERLRAVTQWFIKEWLEYSTNVPYNETVHSNWNYEKYGDDWKEKLGVKE